MKALFRKLLGIDEDHYLLMSFVSKQQGEILTRLMEIDRKLEGMTLGYRVSNAAMARLIAKLDPTYGIPEIDPKRKAESDKLGEAVIKRLKAEDEARRKHG